MHWLTPTSVTGPAPRSLQGIITAEVADHSLSRLGCLVPKKTLGPKRRVSPDVFVHFFSPKPYFSEFCHEDISKTGWRLLEHKSSVSIWNLELCKPFRSETIEVDGACVFWVPGWWIWRGVVLCGCSTEKSLSKATGCLELQGRLRSQFDGMFFMSMVIEVGISNGNPSF